MGRRHRGAALWDAVVPNKSVTFFLAASGQTVDPFLDTPRQSIPTAGGGPIHRFAEARTADGDAEAVAEGDALHRGQHHDVLHRGSRQAAAGERRGGGRRLGPAEETPTCPPPASGVVSSVRGLIGGITGGGG